MANEDNRQGELVGVSVGPGDPELLTLAAVRALREADVVVAPNIGHGRQTALQIASAHVRDVPVLDAPSPMVRDRAQAQAAYERTATRICSLIDQGKRVAYLTLGDASVYSSFSYVARLVRKRGRVVRVIPGVPSFCAAAAALGEPLVEGPGRLLVVPAHGSDAADAVCPGTTTVFMKTGRALPGLRDDLRQCGADAHACLAVDVGLEGERLYPRLEDAPLGESAYFATVIVKGVQE